MKRYERFLFTLMHEKASACVAWLESLDITPTESKVDSYFTGGGGRGDRICVVDALLPIGDDRPDRLSDALANRGLRPGTYTRREEINYSKADRLAAVGCAVLASPNSKVQTGVVYGTQYDWSKACMNCGIGRRQAGPLIAKRSQLPKGKMFVLSESGDMLINQRLRDELVAKVDGTAACLGPVVERDTLEPMDYWQILTRVTLPPHHLSTIGMHCEACPKCGHPVCGHDGTVPYQPAFNLLGTAQGQLAPFMKTFERWGFYEINSNDLRSAVVPLVGLVVRRDVLRILLDLKVRGIELIPVRSI